MDAGQREYLQKRYRSNDWSGRVGRAHRVIKDFDFDGSEIRRWKMQRLRRDQQAKLSVVHSIWSHGEFDQRADCDRCVGMRVGKVST